MAAGSPRRTPVALTIAGSDSGGGAGIQADLKAFARCGVHGTCAITAITAQNTMGVWAIETIRPEIVIEQVRAVARDIGVDAVKVGMLATAEIAHAVAQALDELPAETPVVVDPVMVAESGARLLDEDAQGALISEILPRASVLTPNLPEALVLVGADAARGAAREAARGASPEVTDMGETGEIDEEDAERLARAVLELGPRAVVLTGGHRAHAVDLFVTQRTGGQGVRSGGEGTWTSGEGVRSGGAGAGVGGEVVRIAGERHPGGAAHGSGCTHSSVLAARLALGDTPLQAARTARALAAEAVANGLRELGAGAGPVDVIGLARMRVRSRSRPSVAETGD